MRGSRAGAIVLLLTVTALAGGLTVPATALGEDPDPASELTPEVRDAIQFREALGLETAVEYVVQSFIDPGAFPDTTYGVPLTASEATELAQRQERTYSIQPALDYAAAQVEYAGMFFDRSRHGRPVFRFSDRVLVHRQVLAGLMPAGANPLVVPAAWSLAELMAVYHEIVEDHATWEATLPMVEVDVDVITNHVVVGLERPVPDAAASLVAVYGDIVRVEVLGAIEEDARAGHPEPRERAGLRERAGQ